ncbi:MAG: AAA family ATPase, partial [Anaerolineales bacterium]|nr:AAA family ATPase [Anaerolineales bacterium]
VRLRDQVMNLLASLAENSPPDDAFTYLHRLTALDPLNEPAHRGLMRHYHQQGRPAAALAQYAHLEGLLKTDLDVDPLPETVALEAEIRAAYERQQVEAEPAIPLVGRRHERAALLAAVNAARQGRGGLFLVEGEAGIGKSSLLRDVAAGATWRGVTVGQGSGQELGARTAYLPLDSALADLLAGGRLEQLRESVSPAALNALDAMLPQHNRQAISPLERPADLGRTLLELLGGLSQTSALLLILDDVQWASDTFWEVISFAAELETLPVLLVLAYRPVELRANPSAWQALEALDLAAAPQRLSLTGLSAADSQALAAAAGHELAQAEIEKLARLTGGNPLYLIESLAAELITAPPTLDHLLGLRLERLSAPARAALDLAAVLGRDVDHGQWQAALGKNLAPLLPELLQGRFLQETSQGYAFQHDLIREQVYAQLPAAARRDLHARAALALQQGRAGPAILAWHYEQAGHLDSALHFHRLAGEAAMRTFAYATALGHFEAGYALLADRPDMLSEDVWRLLFARQHMLELTGPVTAWRHAVAEMQTLAGAAPNSALHLATLEAQLQVDALESDIEALQTHAATALELAQQLGETAAEIRIRNVLGWHLMDALAQPRTARDHLERAATLSAALRDPRLQLTVLSNLALAQRLTGQSSLALQTANQMVALTHLHPGLERAQALALQSLANAAMHRAEWQTAWNTINTAVARFEELDDLWALGDALFDRVLISTRLGQLAAARRDIDGIISAQQAMGMAPDSHYRLWSTAYLCLVLVQAGDWQAIRVHLPILQQAASQRASIRVAIQANTVLGLWHLRQGEPATAQQILATAVALWQEGEPSIELSPLLYHALASFQNNDQ